MSSKCICCAYEPENLATRCVGLYNVWRDGAPPLHREDAFMLRRRLAIPVFLSPLLFFALVVCGSNAKISNAGITAGAADVHCVGITPQEANVCICDGTPSGGGNPCTGYSSTAAMAADSNANSTTNDYGATMYGAEGDDDDCKYHVKWSASSAALNTDATFTVSATRLVDGTALLHAETRAEVFLSDTHPAPNTKPAQSVTENPPGTYTISPVQFDASGVWTVRFHFFELCDDTQDNSDHGHAAFYFTVP